MRHGAAAAGGGGAADQGGRAPLRGAGARRRPRRARPGGPLPTPPPQSTHPVPIRHAHRIRVLVRGGVSASPVPAEATGWNGSDEKLAQLSPGLEVLFGDLLCGVWG